MCSGFLRTLRHSVARFVFGVASTLSVSFQQAKPVLHSLLRGLREVSKAASTDRQSQLFSCLQLCVMGFARSLPIARMLQHQTRCRTMSLPFCPISKMCRQAAQAVLISGRSTKFCSALQRAWPCAWCFLVSNSAALGDCAMPSVRQARSKSSPGHFCNSQKHNRNRLHENGSLLTIQSQQYQQAFRYHKITVLVSSVLDRSGNRANGQGQHDLCL